jgi:hypothetical protein
MDCNYFLKPHPSWMRSDHHHRSNQSKDPSTSSLSVLVAGAVAMSDRLKHMLNMTNSFDMLLRFATEQR